MKIVFAIPSMGFGGAERVVSILSSEFSKKHDVSIILTSGKEEIAYNLSKKINIISIPKNLTTVKRWKEFRRICKQLKADVVIAFMNSMGIMATCFLVGTGIPVIMSERCDPSAAEMQLPKKLSIINKFAKFLTKGYVFQSEGAKKCYSKVAQKKSCIILNPLDAENLPKRDNSKEENKIVNVGRLHSQKNQKLLIDAFVKSKFYQDYTLHIYGEGNLRDDLEKQISDLNATDRIFLEGNAKNVHEKIKDSKLFVFTSNYEGLPNALMEAMAMGVPCVSTDCSPGGARMLINNRENGILVPCCDENKLISALDELYDNDELRIKIGRNAVDVVDKTNIELITKQWLDFIRKIIYKDGKVKSKK